MLLKCYKLYKRIQNRVFSRGIRSSFHCIGNNSTIELPFRSSGENFIAISDKVFIGSNSWIEVMGSQPIDRTEAAIIIGEGCSISGHCTITAIENVTLGKKVLIARYVYISDHSHSYSNPEVAIKDQGTTKPKPIVIEDGVWIGQGAVICPGVHIGKNSVIAANSVVKANVPDFTIAAGSPARIIRTIH